MSLLSRNLLFVLGSPARSWRMRQRMKAWLQKEARVCEVCKGSATKKHPLEVHHQYPLWAAPELAETEKYYHAVHNGACHLIGGHAGDYATRYIENFGDLWNCAKIIVREQT